MKSKVSNQNIINEAVVIGTKATIPADFKEHLEISLKNKLIKESFSMKKLILGSLTLLTFGLLFAFVYTTYLTKPSVNNNYDTVTVTDPTKDYENGDGSMGSKLAVDDYNSISEAQNSLSFTVLKPKDTLGSSLARVQTERTFDGSKSSGLYLTFVKGSELHFKLAQRKMSESDFYTPEDAQKVSVNIDGSSIDAYYNIFEPTDIDPNSELMLYEESDPVMSSLTLYYKGLYIEVTEFGSLSVESMKRILESI